MFSSLCYIFLTIGSALVLIRPVWGGLCLLLCGSFGAIMYWVIDPKLKAASKAFESNEQKYLHDLEQSMKWDQADGR